MWHAMDWMERRKERLEEVGWRRGPRARSSQKKIPAPAKVALGAYLGA